MMVHFNTYFERHGEATFEVQCANCRKVIGLMSGADVRVQLLKKRRLLCMDCEQMACIRCRFVCEDDSIALMTPAGPVCKLCELEQGILFGEQLQAGLFTRFTVWAKGVRLSIIPYLKNQPENQGDESNNENGQFGTSSGTENFEEFEERDW